MAGTEIQAGHAGHLDLPVGRLPTDAQLSLPVAVIHGSSPGPTVWLSSALHGDELNGIPIVRGVRLSLDPKKLAGTVILVPVVNVFGLINGSRYLPDRRDLNRSFPGSARGSLASHLAHLFMSEVVERCSFGIDLHSGSGGRTNLPQIRCDLDDAEARRAALAFGAPVVVHSKLRDGSLREAARERGIHVLIYETGEAGRFDRVGIALGVEGILRVLSDKAMLDGPPPPTQPPTLSRKTSWVRAKRSGFCEMRVGLGERVEAGQTLAVVFDALARGEQRVSAHVPGVVIGHQSEALVHRGDAIAHIATVVDEPPAEP